LIIKRKCRDFLLNTLRRQAARFFQISFRFCEKPKSLNRGASILIIRVLDKKADLEIKGGDKKDGGRRDEKRRKKGGVVEKTNEKSLVEMQIPTEEVENIDELVGEGYYGSRSDAIQDIT